MAAVAVTSGGTGADCLPCERRRAQLCESIGFGVPNGRHENSTLAYADLIQQGVMDAPIALAGCGELSAAKIVGEVAGAGRFRSKAAFARWNGTAPIPVWSANDTRQRLTRGGNRQVNAALHRIAITQWRGLGPGQAYVQHRMHGGDSKTEALRLLRRRISDEVFRRLLIDEGRMQASVSSMRS